MADVGTLVARLVADTKGFVSGMAAAQGSLNATTSKMTQFGAAVKGPLVAGAVAAGAAAVKLAVDYESSFAQMEGLVGVPTAELEQFDAAIRNLAGETAKAPQELAEAMFFITSAGLEGADALDALEMSAKASAAGLGDTSTVADAVTSAMNAYGPSVLSASQATDILVATVREGKVEADQVASSLGRVIPVAAEMGISFDQVGASIAAMTRLGLDAAESTTALRSIMTTLIRPSQEAEETLAQFGTSSAELRAKVQDEGLLSVLLDLKNRFGENETALGKVFPNVRALSGALNLVGNNAEEAEAIFAALTDTTGATENAFQTVSETAGFKLQQAMAEMQVALIDIGDALVPAVVGVAKFAAALAPLGGAIADTLAPLGMLGDAMADLSGSTGEAGKEASNSDKFFGAMMESIKDNINPLTRLNGKWEEFFAAGDKPDAKFAALFAGVGAGAQTAANDLADAEAALGGVDTEAAAAAQSVEELDAAFAGLNNSLSKSEAMIAAEEALRGFGEAHAEAAEDGQILRDEQLALNSELNNTVAALRDEAQALNTNADGSVNAAGAQEHLRSKLSALAAFIPAEMLPQWEFLTRDILAVPDEATTTPRAPEIHARQREFQALYRDISRIPPSRNTNVTVSGGAAAAAAANAVARSVRDIPSSKTVRISTNFGAVAEAANAVARSVRNIPTRRSGGPVPGPPGTAQPIMAHGGEFVLSADVVDAIKSGRKTLGLGAGGGASPMSAAAGSGGGGGTTIVVQINGSATARDGQAVVDALRRWSRTNGRVPITTRNG